VTAPPPRSSVVGLTAASAVVGTRASSPRAARLVVGGVLADTPADAEVMIGGGGGGGGGGRGGVATLARPAVAAGGVATKAPPALRLSPAQQRLADAARARVRAERGQWIRSPGDVEELVGGATVRGARPSLAGLRVVPGRGGRVGGDAGGAERCSRCRGRGYLSCLACSD